MKIKDVITENPLVPAGIASRNVGVGVGALAGAPIRAARAYKSGYDSMKQAFSGMGIDTAPPKAEKPAAQPVNKRPVLNKINQGELLDQDEIRQLAKLKQGLEDGSIATQLDSQALIQALDTAISGKRVSPEQRKLLVQFKSEN